MVKSKKARRIVDPEQLAEDERRRENTRLVERLPDHALKVDGNGRMLAGARLDGFDVLLRRGGISQPQHNAVRRLEADWAIRAGGSNVSNPEADRVVAGGFRPPLSYRQLAASDRIIETLGLVGMRDRKILAELLAPQFAGRDADWRKVIRARTGETTPHGQAAAMRGCAENLRLAYVSIDYGRRKIT